MSYDVLIIGGGVVGSAVARELSRYRIRICVLEKNLDVVNETSGRNSGVIHAGFAYDTGSRKARFCLQGNRMMDLLSRELGFRFRRCGKLLVGNTEEDRETLLGMIEQGKRNGVTGLTLLSEKEMKELVPAAVGKFAMFSENSGIVDPFEYTIALAENAAENGVSYFFRSEVRQIIRQPDAYLVKTETEEFRARWIINSAGLGCARVAEMLGVKDVRVIGSKGDYIILDKRVGSLLPMPVYPVPSNTYMGIHVTNTVDGTVIVGPNAVSTEDFSFYGVSSDAISYLAESASRIWPHIHRSDYIRNYSGILPKWIDENGKIQDFRIDIQPDGQTGTVNLIGIESPGLTAAVPIAQYVLQSIPEHAAWAPNTGFQPFRQGAVRFAGLSDSERNQLIREDGDAGEIICRCEKVTRADILRAVHNPLGVCTMTGIKYRTGAMMGRCQGGYCQTRIEKIIEEETGKKPEEILYGRPGSWMFTGAMRKE